MNYFQKNKKNIIIAIISTLLLASIIAFWLQNKASKSSDDIVAMVGPVNLSVGDSLRFEDNTPFAKNKKWDFKDGKTSEKNKGVHVYTKPGFYEVLLTIDNKYTKTFPILVTSRIAEKITDSLDSGVTIDAESQALAHTNVVFRANSETGKTFMWKFGETGNVDSKDKMAIYSYSKPGDYIVTLITDASADPIQHKIKILPAYNEMDDKKEVEEEKDIQEVYNEIDDDFKRRLQQIALGNNFKFNYNYLLSSYMCNNENAVVIVNDEKPKDFYSYCTGLQFNKNLVIQEVKTTYDNSLNCVIKVEVKQSK